MRLYPEHLKKQLNESFAPVYLIVGDEPLQRRDVIDMLRHHCQQQGFETGLKFSTSKQFDWNALFAEFSERSLFCEQQLIELELTTKPDIASSKQLIELSKMLGPAHVLLITCPKLTSAQMRSSWFSHFEKMGIYIPVNSPDNSRLPAWVGRRLVQAGFTASSELITPLCYHFEGNLLGLDQAIIKLQLSYPNTQVNQDQLLSTLSLDSRYTSFQLVDSLLLGEIKQAHHILEQLQAEGIEPIIIAWTINRELLLLLKIKEQLAMGENHASLFKKSGIWQQRQAGFNAALNRLNLQSLSTLLQAASALDIALKTQYLAAPFDSLRALCDGFAAERGQTLLSHF